MAAGTAPAASDARERIARLASITGDVHRPSHVDQGREPSPTASAEEAPKKRRKPDPVVAWGRRIARYRPGLVEFTLDELAGIYGSPEWERRLDPTSELILTILTQNTADTNAEVAFERLRAAYPSGLPPEAHRPGEGWGGRGLAEGAPPDWARVEMAPIEELMDVIRPAGIATQKAPRIQASLRKIREERGDYSLEFLGEMTALEAREWLTGINGIAQEDRVGRAAVLFRAAARADRPARGAGPEAGRPAAAEGHRRPVPRDRARAASTRSARTRPTST